MSTPMNSATSVLNPSAARPSLIARFSQTQITLAITAVVFVLLYSTASVLYRDSNFFSLQVFLNFFYDNAALGVVAIGMTFVILSGGIDLSVGSMVGFTTVLIATLVERQHFHPASAIAIALLCGTLFGAGQGCLIRFFDLAPFLVTLGGMFLAKGLGFVITLEALPIHHELFTTMADWSLPLGTQQQLAITAILCAAVLSLAGILSALLRSKAMWRLAIPLVLLTVCVHFGLAWHWRQQSDWVLPVTALTFISTLILASILASFTRFGRNVYAIGGNEQSATLMGLPVGLTKIGVYALNGFCAALAGVVMVLYMPSGNAANAGGWELDAIAAVVIGGTLLSGGVGHVFGTLLGVLILGTILTAINFDGRLSSWWTKIAIGLLLFVFVLLQRILSTSLKRRRQ